MNAAVHACPIVFLGYSWHALSVLSESMHRWLGDATVTHFTCSLNTMITGMPFLRKLMGNPVVTLTHRFSDGQSFNGVYRSVRVHHHAKG
ncbi:hypothetical protein BD769DRAFT_1412287 [Suillus cothurnatus]|nr:hypothetical protein BD769DRAFT_1412287 [Suillus cothurnatus]